MRGRRGFRLLAGAVIVLFPLACSPDEQAPEVSAYEEFAGVFEGVSERHRERVGQAQEDGRAALGAGSAAVLDVYRLLRDIAAATDDDLKGLDTPDQLWPRVARLRDNLQQQVASLDRVIAGAEADDESALSAALQQYAALLVDFTTLQHAIDQELARGP